MGCGCLQPPKQKQEVYVHLINQIHSEAPKISSSKQPSSDFSNLDLYQVIKEKINKKGYLRKLIDNLASHRSRIPDSMSRNFNLVSTLKQLPNSYAGIIIADFIIDGIYKNPQGQEKAKDQSIQSTYTNHINESKTFTMNKSAHKSKNNMMQLSEPLSREIDSRFDLSYFHLLQYLLQSQKRMYHRVLDSISNICSKRQEKFLCEGEVWKILKIILSQIKDQSLVQESSKAFNLLLNKTKQHMYEQFKNPLTLYTIIREWMRSGSNDGVRENFELILQTYLNRSISCWQSQFMYEVIFKIFDEEMFIDDKVIKLQNIIQSIVTNHDLSQHFFRGFFMFLLHYLSHSHDQKIDKSWSSSHFEFKYLKTKGEHEYKNILDEKVKMNGLRMLGRWIDKKYINIDEIILYNSKSLLFTYIINIMMYKNVKKLCNVIIQQLLKALKTTNEESKQILVQRMLEQFRENRQSKELQILLKLIKQVMSLDTTIQLSSSNIFPQIQTQYLPEIKLQIIMLTGFILQRHKYIQYCQAQYKHNISQFLYSIYKNITHPSQTLHFKYQFICSIVSLMKIISVKLDKAIILAFVHTLNNLMYPPQLQSEQSQTKTKENLINKKKIIPQTQYCLLYLIFQLRQLLFKSLKVPTPMIKLNFKISGNMDEEVVRRQIGKYLQNVDQIQMQKVFASTSANEDVFKKYCKTLQTQFSEEEEEEMELIRNSRKMTHFERQNSVVESENQEVSELGMDKSFQQIMDIIND